LVHVDPPGGHSGGGDGAPRRGPRGAQDGQWERDAADPDHAAARTATLTSALQLLLARDAEEVIPVAFSPGYGPRMRALPAGELSKLLAELVPDRAARVVFLVSTSACWRETELARREDGGEGQVTVLLCSTKQSARHRTVPVVSPAQRSLLAHALEHTGGTKGSLFTPWRNARRDLAEACERAGIERCSPNDLRRTFASWQVEAGVPLFPIAQAMSHKDTRMLERVYGRQAPDKLAALMTRAMGLPTKNCRARATLRSGGPMMSDEMLVPGPGIEPGTRGFSVPCSTS